MRTYRYLIVGTGMAARAAAAGIREVDPNGTLAVVGDEPFPPYARPPLSKGLWTGKPTSEIWLDAVPGVDVHGRRRAIALDVDRHEVRDDDGGHYRYERLLLATGGRPRRLPWPEVMYFRTLQDQERLAAVRGREVLVVGGGFIGSELAAALTQTGRSVTMLFPEAAIGARAYPPGLAAFVTRYFAERGVRVLSREALTGLERAGDRIRVRTSSSEVEVDAVVAGIGIEPNVELAREAGVAVSDGIEVDERLRTTAPDVWAAGDVARFPYAALGAMTRVEHEDNALTMGRTAGLGMAGREVRYDHLPFFYSDLFDLGYEAVGNLDARLEVVESWKTEGREGVCWYLDGGRVRGVLLWGIFGQVDAARELIRRGARLTGDQLRGAITP